MRKQSMTHDDFVRILHDTPSQISREDFERAFARTVDEVTAVTAGKHVGYAWSGGKDSIALELVMDAAGIHECMFGRTDLEYHAFTDWLTTHQPPDLVIYNNSWDVDWLKRHESMLFAYDARTRGQWYHGIWLVPQLKFAKTRKLDILITGKRRDDGNVLVDPQAKQYVSGGVNRYAPLWNWTHADVFAALIYRDRMATLPPFYGWPRGYRAGTHAWAARKSKTWDDGFADVLQIEPARVIEAADRGFRPAQRWLGTEPDAPQTVSLSKAQRTLSRNR
jgi:hypothetical protein